MLERLANVLYWIGCSIAALSAILGIYLLFKDGSFGEFLFAGVIAVLAWLVGKALRYILTGR